MVTWKEVLREYGTAVFVYVVILSAMARVALAPPPYLPSWVVVLLTFVTVVLVGLSAVKAFVWRARWKAAEHRARMLRFEYGAAVDGIADAMCRDNLGDPYTRQVLYSVGDALAGHREGEALTVGLPGRLEAVTVDVRVS